MITQCWGMIISGLAYCLMKTPSWIPLYIYVCVCVCVCIYIIVLIDLFMALLGLCCCAGFSPVVVSGGHSLVAVRGFSSRWHLLLWSTGSRVLEPH